MKSVSRVQTLCDPMDCSLPGSSVHGIFQAIVLEWIAISFSRGSSWPRGSNPGLPHCRQKLYCLSHQRSPIYKLLKLNQFSSVAKSYWTFWDPMNNSMPGLPVYHKLSEFIQTHVHRVGDAIQPSHPLSPPSPTAPNPSQHQGHFQWVNSSHEVAKVLEFQLQHQSLQWTPRTDLL